MRGSVQTRLEAELEQFRADGVYKRLNYLDSPQAPRVTMEGRGEVIILSSNNYLGLSNHPAVVAAGGPGAPPGGGGRRRGRAGLRRPGWRGPGGVLRRGGDTAPPPGIADPARRYDATVVMDDSHATGVLGAT